jgi:hypothetical protein
VYKYVVYGEVSTLEECPVEGSFKLCSGLLSSAVHCILVIRVFTLTALLFFEVFSFREDEWTLEVRILKSSSIIFLVEILALLELDFRSKSPIDVAAF